MLIGSKVDMKLNKNLKMKYFCKKPQKAPSSESIFVHGGLLLEDIVKLEVSEWINGSNGKEAPSNGVADEFLARVIPVNIWGESNTLAHTNS